MKNKRKMAPKDKKSSVDASQTNARRRFELQALLQFGKLPYERIVESFKCERQSIHQDAEVLRELGFAVEMMREGGKGVLVLLDKGYQSTKAIRSSIEREQKEEIAQLVTGLIWGPPSHTELKWEEFFNHKNESILRQCSRPVISAQIERFLQGKGNLVASKAEKVLAFLREYWKKNHRSIAIDAGTTTEKVAEFLKGITIPDNITKLGDLRILTNSPAILTTFSTARSAVNVIILGGAVRRETEAITGELARQCLESAWRMALDLAIIGTTNISLEDGSLSCDSEDEAVTKNQLLDRATLKCVVASASKFNRQVCSSFPFGGRNAIDLVITDSSATEDHERALAELGIIMLRAQRDTASTTKRKQGPD